MFNLRVHATAEARPRLNGMQPAPGCLPGANSWIEAVFHDCIYTAWDAFSFALGKEAEGITMHIVNMRVPDIFTLLLLLDRPCCAGAVVSSAAAAVCRQLQEQECRGPQPSVHPAL